MSCNFVAPLANSGVAVRAPNLDYITIVRNGRSQLARWQAYADGYQGYVPVGAKYLGKGVIGSATHGQGLGARTFKTDTNLGALNGATGEADLGQSLGMGLFDGGQRKQQPTPTPIDPIVTDEAGRQCRRSESKEFFIKRRGKSWSMPVPHAWLKIPNGSTWESWGFGPIGWAMHGPGAVENNSNINKYPEDGSLTYLACPESLRLLVDSINRSRNDSPSNLWYNYNNNPKGWINPDPRNRGEDIPPGYNCAGMVCKWLEDAGFRPPKPSSTIGLYPGDLNRK